MKLSRRPPSQCERLLRAGGIVRVFEATHDAVQEAQSSGSPMPDIEAAEMTAMAALLWLRVVVVTRWTRTG
jgi:hypothetical protein